MNKKGIKNIYSNKYLGAIICTLLCVAFYGLYAYAHYVNDDYYYLFPFYDYKINGASLNFSEVLLWLGEQVNLNLRLSNQISILLLLLPHWVCDVLSVIIMGAMVVGLMKMLKIRKVLSLSMALLLSLLVLVLPWYDQILCINFRINYVWSSAIVILYLYLFISYCKDWRLYKKVLFWGISIIASMFHEGAITPLFFGLIAQYLLSKKSLTKMQILSLVIVAIGIIILLFTPGFSSRIDSSLHWRSIKSYLLYMCGYNLPSLIFILLVIYALIRGYYRKMLEHNIPIYFVAAIVGCGIFMISPVIRASWFPTLFSIIGFVVLLKDVFAVRVKYKNTLTIAMYSIIFCHLGASCYYSKIIYSEWEAIAAKYEKGVDANYYSPITLEKDIPLITLGKAYGFRHQCWGNNIMSHTAHFYKVDRKVLAVPADLESVDKSQLEKIGGDNPFYWYGHYILMPKEKEECEPMYTVKIQPLKGVDLNLFTRAKMMYIDFKTQSGEEFYLVAANYQALQPVFDNVVEINR
ncbi:MAG: hypothetical protein IJ352_06030 [Muribaculaceae bacterium]|nr:hypothetical protein [Muribaculaceae bacterium]